MEWWGIKQWQCLWRCMNQRLETVKLLSKGPGGASEPVAVDRFTADNFAADPTDGGTVENPEITEDSERPGRAIPDVVGDIPTIAPFGLLGTSNTLGTYPTATITTVGQGGQIVLRNDGELHSLGELFYIPTVTNTASSPALIVAMENQPGGDSNYRLVAGDATVTRVLRNLTLRTGLNDGADNDGDTHIDDGGSATAEEILREARVPGLININTAPANVLAALHVYPEAASIIWTQLTTSDPYNPFNSLGELAQAVKSAVDVNPAWSKDEDPDGDGVGTPDGITVDNEEKLFHFRNVANLISVRSDVFVVYITIQASDRDGIFQDDERIMRTMAIVDRSFCLRPFDSSMTTEERLKDIPLPRIVAQTTIP